LLPSPPAMPDTSDIEALRARLASLDKLRRETGRARPATIIPEHWSEKRRTATMARRPGTVSRLESGAASFVHAASFCPAESEWGRARRERVDAGDVQGAVAVEVDYVAKELGVALCKDPEDTAELRSEVWEVVEDVMEALPESGCFGFVEKEGVLYPADAEDQAAAPAMEPKDIITQVQERCAATIQQQLEQCPSRYQLAALPDADEVSKESFGESAEEDVGFKWYCGRGSTDVLSSCGEEQEADSLDAHEQARTTQAEPTRDQKDHESSQQATEPSAQLPLDQFLEEQANVTANSVKQLQSRIWQASEQLRQQFASEASSLRRDMPGLRRKREVQRKVWRDATTEWRQLMHRTRRAQEESLRRRYQEELRNSPQPSEEKQADLRERFAEAQQAVSARFRLEAKFLEQSVQGTEIAFLGPEQPDDEERLAEKGDCVKLIATVLTATALGASGAAIVFGAPAVVLGGLAGLLGQAENQAAAALGKEERDSGKQVIFLQHQLR